MRPHDSTPRQQFVKLCGYGCGESTLLATMTNARLGHVAGQPLPYLRFHYQRNMITRHTPAPDDRFWSKVDAFGDCWEWTDALLRSGYGSFKLSGGKNVRAHRFAWELLVGPIPDGMVLDHLCRNRRCVNPDHLEVVTQEENMRRGYGATARNARKTHCHNGHPFDETNTSYEKGGARRCKTCQRENKQRELERLRAATAARRVA